MRDNRTPKALPPLLGHYADALNALRDAVPQALSHLTPLHYDLESVAALAQQALRNHPDSEAAQRVEQLREAHRQPPDLTTSDSDRLVAKIRLIFAGTLTMLLGIAFVLRLIEVKIGHFPITDIATYPMLAFIVGVFLRNQRACAAGFRRETSERFYREPEVALH